MKLIDVYRLFGLNSARSIAKIFFKHCPDKKEKLEAFISKNKNFEFDVPDISSIISLMDKLNKEVKHESCPNNKRNHFYTKKHQVIKHFLETKQVEQIIESDNVYKFVIGSYSFHQPKTYWPDISELVNGTEEYQNKTIPIPFNEDDYKRFCVSVWVLSMKRRMTQF